MSRAHVRRRPFPIDDLYAAAGVTHGEWATGPTGRTGWRDAPLALAHRLGLDPAKVYRAASTHDGMLTPLIADRWAGALEMHPTQIWADWFVATARRGEGWTNDVD